MKSKNNNDELLKEYLDNGGKIKKCPPGKVRTGRKRRSKNRNFSRNLMAKAVPFKTS